MRGFRAYLQQFQRLLHTGNGDKSGSLFAMLEQELPHLDLQLRRHEPIKDVVQDDHVHGGHQFGDSGQFTVKYLYSILHLMSCHGGLLNITEVLVDFNTVDLSGRREDVSPVEDGAKSGAYVQYLLRGVQRGKEPDEYVLEPRF